MSDLSRRLLLAKLPISLTLLMLPASLVALTVTPRQTRGPFYPPELPLDHDNDLVLSEGRTTLAQGTITHLTGQVFSTQGQPIQGARVEIWQCDAFGRYHHPGDRADTPLDENFQGYGQFLTDGDGFYYFRTIRPVAYPGRTPHIHLAVTPPGGPTLVTQMYIKGEADNQRDFLFNRLTVEEQAAVQVDLQPYADEGSELSGQFAIVLPG